VTGATGFVGPHLRSALLAEGHEVWTTDRADSPTEKHLRCDLLDPAAVRHVFEASTPDWVFHLAGQSSVGYSFENPQDVLRTNIVGACNVFEAIRAVVPAARTLVVGSAEEYGSVSEDRQPITEDEPLRPASPYAVSKVAQELLALQYGTSHALAVVLARSFNHSGPGQSDRFVLPSFARQIARAELGLQEDVIHVGNLDVWRDYLDVRDVVHAYRLLVEKGVAGSAYNICRGEAFRIGDLLDALFRRARRPIHAEVDPTRWRPVDLPVLRGDPTRLREATGWRPHIPLDTTLDDILDDWRQRVQAGSTP